MTAVALNFITFIIRVILLSSIIAVEFGKKKRFIPV